MEKNSPWLPWVSLGEEGMEQGRCSCGVHGRVQCSEERVMFPRSRIA